MKLARYDGPLSDDGWTSEVSSGFALAGFLFLVFIGFTLLAMGPLKSIDAYFNVATPPPGWVPALHVLDRIGQRAICLPILGVITLFACRRQESWRPAVVVGVSVFMLNLIVLILKLGLGRDEPATANPAFFHGGMAYPSGHSSNIVLVYGLVVYILGRYRSPGRRLLAVLWGLVGVLSVMMVVTSLTLNWHWFADLIAGLIIGSMVLQLTASVNAAVPSGAFDQGLRAGLRSLPGSLRHPGHWSHPGPDHSGPDHSGPDHSGPDHSGLDHSGPDHSELDHPGSDHSGPDHSELDRPELDHPGSDRSGPDDPGEPDHPDRLASSNAADPVAGRRTPT